MVFSTMHVALLLLPMSNRSLLAVYERRSDLANKLTFARTEPTWQPYARGWHARRC